MSLAHRMPTIEQARAWYPQADAVHNFDHVLRVHRLAKKLAQAEGADWQIVSAAVLLHDAQGERDFAPGEARPAHHLAAAEFAAQVLEAEGWSPSSIQAVQHCIRAHRFRDNSEQPQTLEARVVFDADKLDAIGAVGAARAIAFAAQDGKPFFSVPSEQFLETGLVAPGEEHSAYHEYLFKLRKLKDRLYTAEGRRMARARHRYLAGFFARLSKETVGEA